MCNFQGKETISKSSHPLSGDSNRSQFCCDQLPLITMSYSVVFPSLSPFLGKSQIR